MVQTDMSRNLQLLPDEILRIIAQYLNARSLLSLGSTARKFAALTNEPLLWKKFCREEYRYWKSRQAFRQLLRDGNFHDWRNVYKDRQRISRDTRDILVKIILDPRCRSDRIKAIVDHGYKAKDALLQAYNESPSSPYHLAQKYWSHVVLGCLHRTIALATWTEIKYGRILEDQTERALAAFDMFILDQHERGDVDDILDRLDEYVETVRTLYPDLDEQTPQTKAVTIASVLRSHHWVGIDRGRPYHSLDNMFLGVALFSQHNNSLPLITSVIYSYVARKFGLRAQPISYPIHVHVVVQSPPGIDLDGNPLPPSHDPNTASPKTHMYMDPFNSIEPVTLSTLETNLRFIAPTASPAQASGFLSPATHRDLLIRSAHNIINSTTMGQAAVNTATNTGTTSTQPQRSIPSDSAIYAAYYALTFFPTHPASLRTNLTELTQHFLHHFDQDLHTFRTFILPLTSNLPDHLAFRNLSIQLFRNDAEAAVPKLRSSTTDTAMATSPSSSPSLYPTNTNTYPKYRVGSLFRHRRRDYLALIYGWDPTCEMTQQWISMNQVDRLPRGRNQPFYNVLVIDDRSTRYVAEENVVLLGPVVEGGNGEMVDEHVVVDRWPIEVGKWMRRFLVESVEQVDGVERRRGWRFESNVRDEYPDD